MKRMTLALSVVAISSMFLAADPGAGSPVTDTIHMAAERGDTAAVKRHMESGADINERAQYRRTPLHVAAFQGHAEVVRLLIEKGADLNMVDATNRVPLQLTFIFGYTDIARMLIEAGADLDKKDRRGISMLHFAIERGREEIAHMLLDRQMEIDARDNDERTPLHYACFTGLPGIAQRLVEEGADVNSIDHRGTGIIHLAAMNGHPEILKTLIDSGADIHLADRDGKTALHLAAENGKRDAVVILARAGTDVNAETAEGKTALYIAARAGQAEAARALAETGAYMDAGDENTTALFFAAARNGYTAIIELMLDMDVDINTTDSGNLTAAHAALAHGQKESAMLLISRDADLYAKDKDGVTPLHWAAFRGYDNILTELAGAGKPLNARDMHGRTPHDWAAFAGKHETARILLANNSGNNAAAPANSASPGDTPEYANLLANPGMLMENGRIPGWRTGSPAHVQAEYDSRDGALVLHTHGWKRNGIHQELALSPGHYLFRALVKTETYAMALYAHNHGRTVSNLFMASMYIGVSDEYKWVELPFCVDDFGEEEVAMHVSVAAPYGDPSRHRAATRIKQAELIRLGDTAMDRPWEPLMADRGLFPASFFTPHPLHELHTINTDPKWDRPGKVIFKDTFLGTELWLMTQEGKTDHSYSGALDFSHDGKYIYTGMRRPPKGFIRTDGSRRHIADWDISWLPWLFPWEEKRLPESSNLSDWVSKGRTTQEINLYNLATSESATIELPSRPGWEIIRYTSLVNPYRGVNIREIKDENIVWLTQDRSRIGVSNMEGENFRSFEIKSASADPRNDKVHTSISSAWGKGGGNWHNALDRDGNLYFVFDLNRDNRFDDQQNPYQVWMLPLNPADSRGLLQAVPNPKVDIFQATNHKWWDLAAGLPRSGDDALLVLEDGTYVHMSSLGMHSRFHGTVRTQCPYSGQVSFIGNFPLMDRVCWPHPFKHDRHFAVVESFVEPHCPVVMIDLEHRTLWPLAMSNFHD